jgi:hypothetical protein
LNLLWELHSKEFDCPPLLDVQEQLEMTLQNLQYDPILFSLFCNCHIYAGKVPTRDYIAAVYKESHHDLHPFLDAKMNKINLYYLMMEISNKAEKKAK